MIQAESPQRLLWALLGFQKRGVLQAVVEPTLLTASLFAGPLLQLALSGRSDADVMAPLQQFRNLVMAPVTEEFCFRACMVPLFLLQVCCFIGPAVEW